jgi:hypothetical protein
MSDKNVKEINLSIIVYDSKKIENDTMRRNE